MNEKTLIERPTIELPVQCGMIRKAAIREATNATAYEFELTVKMMSARDEKFKKKYEQWKTSWSLPEALAVEFVRHLYPGYFIRVVLEG